jgi:two-component system chemotaxis response regulator CheB
MKLNYSNALCDKSEILRIGVVDDSLFIRQIIRQVINDTKGMMVVGEAGDPYEARQMIKDANPDVITLDIEMPRMNGLDFLDKIMRLRPMPVVMVSTLTKKGAEATLKALEVGAVDYVPKPEMGELSGNILENFKESLISKLKMAQHVDVSKANRSFNNNLQNQHQLNDKKSHLKKIDLIAVASSTGGIERLRYLVSNLRGDVPPILVVQHINALFVESMAVRMQSIAPEHIKIKVAKDVMFLEKNTIYLADNKKHLTVVDKAGRLCVRLLDAPPLNGFIASADYLFESLVKIKNGAKSVFNPQSFILSGMGCDGAKGALALKKAGGYVIGEREDSCLVYGMSKAAKDLSAVDKEMSIEQISFLLNDGIKVG